MSVTLRPEVAADREFLVRLYGTTRAAELAQVDWTAAQKEAFVASQFAAQAAHYRANYAGATYDVIEVDGQPVGRLYVARGSTEIRVMDLALLPEHCGQGTGTALLTELCAEADATGKLLSIHVEKLNPARALYERMGFVGAGDRGVYFLLERPARATR